MADDMTDVNLFELSDAEIAQLCEPFFDTKDDDILEIIPSSSRDEVIHDVNSFIESQKKKNTSVSTIRDIRNVQRWLWETKQEPKLIELICPSHLNIYLAELFISIRKKDGSEYEPGSLEAIRNSVERHLKDKEYPVSIRSREFHKASEALKSKKLELKKQGKGRKCNAAQSLSSEEENKLFKEKQLGPFSPQSLQFSLFYFLGKIFGFRGRDEHRKLRFEDVSLGLEVDGTEFLEWAERDSKTRDGSHRDDCRLTTPRLYAPADSDDSRNPIALYKLFLNARPESRKSPDSPFYLTPIPEKRLSKNSTIWYYPTPMGEHRLGEIMKKAAEAAGLSGKITNHSVRKTTVQLTLVKSGVAAHKVMQITGHKSLSSIQEYDNRLDHSEQRQFSNILQSQFREPTHHSNEVIAIPSQSTSQNPKSNCPSTSLSASSSRDYSNLFGGAVFNNCTFNFQ